MPNRLAQSSSLYLRQHAENPVDWHPWGDDAFALARETGRAVFLSIGYSSCHWCHVMAHESFEDPEVADALNRAFVCVKVDREERPDVDDVYMTATQIANGHGGWPMTLFLTPEREPFFAGTYFPKARLLDAVAQLAEAWKGNRSAVRAAAADFAKAVKEALAPMSGVPEADLQGVADRAVRAMGGSFDQVRGGFGTSPKFPPYCDLLFLLDYVDSGGCESRLARQMFELTVHQMVRGGVFDHVGGGFHRYSVDSEWHLPHFEKILSDNALALHVLTRCVDAGIDSDGSLEFAVVRTRDWIEREMRLPTGGWANALDSGAGGEEGAPYVWDWSELEDTLGSALPEFAAAYGLLPEGNYPEEATRRPSGLNVLHRAPGAPVLADALDRLMEARARLPQPARDEKAVAGPNALVSEAFRATPPRIWWETSQIPHQLDGGSSLGLGFLDDHAQLGHALVSARENVSAMSVAEAMLLKFAQGGPGLALSADEHGTPLTRPVSVFDSATPSAFASALLLLVRLGRVDEATRRASPFLHWAGRSPLGCGTLLRVVLALARQPLDTLAVVARLNPPRLKVGKDGYAHAVLTLEVPDGYQIGSHAPEDAWSTPTSVKVEGVLGEAGFPEDRGPFRGVVHIPVRLMPRGPKRQFTLTVGYQMCSDGRCHLPAQVVLQNEIELGDLG